MRFTSFIIVPALLALTVSTSPAQAPIDTHWVPITDGDRQQNAPRVDKSAGVEALFWRVHVWDEVMGRDWQRVFSHYVRLKVFNDDGKKRLASIDIPFDKDTGITDLAARSIKPDGTIVELKKEDVHEREQLRSNGFKRRVKSFALPGVEPGTIVEYRYREYRFKANFMYLRAYIQQDYPVQKFTYQVKPFDREDTMLRMRVWPFNCSPPPMTLDQRTGFNVLNFENLPAFQTEPYMPSEPNVRAWVLIYYTREGKKEPEKYWNERGKEIYRQLKLSLKINDEIKAAAAKVAAEAAGDEAKVVALISYLRKNLRGFNENSVTDAERTQLIKSMPKDRSRTSTEVFKSGIGTADELNTLFAAMAQSLGLDARPILLADRNDILFHPQLAESYFLRNVDMAVKLGDQWKIYDVSTRRLPPNMIGWSEEGMLGLLSDPKEPAFLHSAVAEPNLSAAHRRGTFELAEDGTLSGKIELFYTGHRAADEREDMLGESAEKQAESVRKEFAAIFPSAEISAIDVQNVEDTTQPLTIKFRLSIPAYAQRTGRRLLFTPFFFQAGSTPRFSASTRLYDVHFRYAWEENDRVTIKLPEGFELDNPEAPSGLAFAPQGNYQIKMQHSPDGELIASRVLTFGTGGRILFPKTAYPQLKQLFDEIHRRDATMFSIRQVRTGAGAQ